MQDWLTVGEKLKRVRLAKGLNQSEFAHLVGVGQPNLSKYEKNKVIPEPRTLKDVIIQAGINKHWWETGQGEMFVEESAPVHQNKRPSNGFANEASPLDLVDPDDVSKNWAGTEFRDLEDGQILMTISLVDEFAYAGYLSGWKDAEFLEELPKHSLVVSKRHAGRYRAFVVRGDSMDNDRRNAICAGDIVVGRNIEKSLWNSKFHLHSYEDYIIVHQDGILVKRIVKHQVKEGIISCSSTNPDKDAYPDFDLKLSEVYELYNIISVERKWKV